MQPAPYRRRSLRWRSFSAQAQGLSITGTPSCSGRRRAWTAGCRVGAMRRGFDSLSLAKVAGLWPTVVLLKKGRWFFGERNAPARGTTTLPASPNPPLPQGLSPDSAQGDVSSCFCLWQVQDNRRLATACALLWPACGGVRGTGVPAGVMPSRCRGWWPSLH